MRRLRKRMLVALSMTACVAVCGCQPWNWRGNGYDEQTNSLTENVRPEGDERKFTGFDERARDIERNLGVR